MRDKIKDGILGAGGAVKAAAKWYSMRRRHVHGWAHIAVPLAALAALLAVRASGWDWVEELQHRSFDGLIRLKPRVYEPAPVRIVDIDDESLAKLGQWPWPRTLLARLVDRLNGLGVGVIAFDAVFAEPDRTSPALAVRSWPDTPEVRALKRTLGALPDSDEAFAAAVSRSSVVTGFALTSDANGAVPAVKAGFAYGGDDPLGYLQAFSGAVVNLPVIDKAAAGSGSFNFISETDGVVRRVPLLFNASGRLAPALSAEALRVAVGARGYKIKSSGASGEIGGHTGISSVRIGPLTVPTDGKGRIWVYFTETVPGRTVPAWKVLDNEVDPGTLEGTIAFVGTSAEGLKDLRVTALNPLLPGVEAHANVAEQIMLGRHLARPDWAMGAELLYMLFLGLLLVLLLPSLGAVWCAWVGGAGVAFAVYASWRAFSVHGYLLDPLFPVLTVVLVYMSSSLISYMKSETERRQVRTAFSRYMHPKLVEELARHPEKLALGGETRPMTILFCDIRGFTTISEQYDAHGLTRVINRFLTPMTGVIMDKFGYVDKYIGDCIMAFWNAPLDDPRHASNACDAALTMLERLAELNEVWRLDAEREGRKHIPIRIGVGLNTGDCCVGNMGADQRFNYSVLGDDVNLASRLEGQSKPYGVGVVIGPRTREQAAEHAALELDLIKVKGKTVPVRIFALLGRKDMMDSPGFRAHEAAHDAMLSAYRGRDWKKAACLLAECRGMSREMATLYGIYEERIRFFEANPPGDDWDGTYTATSK